MQRSPRVEIRERAIPTTPQVNPGQGVAVIGFSGKGPENTPVDVYSFEQFQNIFGKINKEEPFAYMATRKLFQFGNRVLFYRLVPANAKIASKEIQENIAAVDAKISFTSADLTEKINELTLTSNPVDLTISYGDTLSYDFSILTEETEVGSGVYKVSQTVVKNTIIENSDFEKISGAIEGTLAGSGEISKTDVTFTADDSSLTVPFTLESTGSEAEKTRYRVTFESKDRGESSNLISVKYAKRVNQATGVVSHDIFVLYEGIVVETFSDVNIAAEYEGASSFFVERINRTPDNGGSSFITASVFDLENTETSAVFVEETSYDLEGGENGLFTFEEKEDAFIQSLSINGELSNPDLYDFEILITPDIQSTEVDTAALKLCEESDAFYIVDPEMEFSSSQVKEWHNGNIEGGKAFDNSYGALYWPWLKEFSRDTREYTWCPPSVFMAAKFVEIDSTYGPWAAPAGDLRGRLEASDLETSPNIRQRDDIYGGENAVNPFVFFNTKGILVYGQKTLSRKPDDPLNRVNVRRTVIHIKKELKRRMEQLLFEANNPDTWRRAYRSAVDVLSPIKEEGGLNDYKVIIDERVNTAEDIQAGIMNGLITIVPEGTIEEIKLNINVQSAGTTITEE